MDLKLYIYDFGDEGMVMAVAATAEEAKRLIREKTGSVYPYEPDAYDIVDGLVVESEGDIW